MAFLRFETQGCHRPRFKPLYTDRLPRLAAIAISAVLDPAQRLVYLDNKLARPVARPQFKAAAGFVRCAVCKICRF